MHILTGTAYSLYRVNLDDFDDERNALLLRFKNFDFFSFQEKTDSFVALLHETETETACDHVTLIYLIVNAKMEVPHKFLYRKKLQTAYDYIRLNFKRKEEVFSRFSI